MINIQIRGKKWVVRGGGETFTEVVATVEVALSGVRIEEEVGRDRGGGWFGVGKRVVGSFIHKESVRSIHLSYTLYFIFDVKILR